MQYTEYEGCVLTAANKHQGFDVEVRVDELYQALASIPDPRRAQGRVYWLPSLLCLAIAGILCKCNCLSVLAIAEWAAGLSPQLRQALGLDYPQTAAPTSPLCTECFVALIHVN